MRLHHILASSGFLWLLISGCESTSTKPSPVAKKAVPVKKKEAPPKKPASSLSAGRSLYYGRCTSCHAAEPPNYYTKSEWRTLISHMRERAKLTPAEESSLMAFVLANADPG